MNRILLSTTLSLAAATPFALRGQDLPENPNRISFGPTFGMNFKGDFHYNNSANPGPATGGADHTYNDGYVLVDSSGNAGGLTVNWGYQNAAQYNAGGDAMEFHALPSGGSSATADNPQYGAEILYQRVLGTFPFMSGDWGLESAFGFTKIEVRQNLGGTVPVTMDSYSLNGVIPPGAGYNGNPNGPGALLGDTPARTLTSAAISGYQKLSGESFSLRLGPFAEFYFTPKLSLAASVGLTVAPTVVDYDFSETATLAGGEVIVANGHSSSTGLLYGPYVGGMLRYDFTKCWGIYVGARFQNLTDLSQSIGDHSARLDPGTTLFGSLGISWRF